MLHVYIYIYTHTHYVRHTLIYICIYIYIYTHCKALARRTGVMNTRPNAWARGRE